MNKLSILPIAVMIAVLVTSCNETKIQNITMKNSSDSLSYAIGFNIGQSFKEQKITEINTEMMAAVINAIISGDTSALKMNDSSSIAFLNSYMQKKQEADQLAAKAEGQKWLDDNGKKPGVVTTASGLQYQVISSGTGVSPKSGERVQANYTGKFLDGKVFDSNAQSGAPVIFNIDGPSPVIEGLTEALKLMKEGDKWNVFIPSDLAYGPGGYQGVIPPNSTLIFEVELLKVLPPEVTPTK